MKKLLIHLLLIIPVNTYSQNDLAALQQLISKDSSSIPFLCSFTDSFLYVISKVHYLNVIILS